MKIVTKETNRTVPMFGDLAHGDLFFSPAAENPNDVYMVIDGGGYENEAVNLASGYVEEFGERDAVRKVEGTLTIE